MIRVTVLILCILLLNSCIANKTKNTGRSKALQNRQNAKSKRAENSRLMDMTYKSKNVVTSTRYQPADPESHHTRDREKKAIEKFTESLNAVHTKHLNVWRVEGQEMVQNAEDELYKLTYAKCERRLKNACTDFKLSNQKNWAPNGYSGSNCDWFEEDHARCDFYEDFLGDEMSAKEACCTCGGGKRLKNYNEIQASITEELHLYATRSPEELQNDIIKDDKLRNDITVGQFIQIFANEKLNELLKVEEKDLYQFHKVWSYQLEETIAELKKQLKENVDEITKIKRSRKEIKKKKLIELLQIQEKFKEQLEEGLKEEEQKMPLKNNETTNYINLLNDLGPEAENKVEVSPDNIKILEKLEEKPVNLQKEKNHSYLGGSRWLNMFLKKVEEEPKKSQTYHVENYEIESEYPLDKKYEYKKDNVLNKNEDIGRNEKKLNVGSRNYKNLIAENNKIDLEKKKNNQSYYY